MEKRIYTVIMVLTASGGMLHATSEFRSPLHLYRGQLHYPIELPDDTEWEVEFLGGHYARSADRAFINDCDPQKSTTTTQRLATLFFGKECFKAEESFCNGSGIVAGNPFVNFALIAPQFDYNEKGAVIGLHIQKRLEDSKWRFGMRATLPFKVIEVERNAAGPGLHSGGPQKFEEGLDDVIAKRIEFIGFDSQLEFPGGAPSVAAGRTNCAYRLDFLSALTMQHFPRGSTQLQSLPLLIFGTGALPDVQASHTTIAQTRLDVEQPQQAQVHLLRSNSGTAPKERFAVDFTPGVTTPVEVIAPAPISLNAQGTNGNNGERLYFQSNKVSNQPNEVGPDYRSGLGADRNAQRNLWVVPVIRTPLPGVGGGALGIENAGLQIEQAITMVLNHLNLTGKTSAENFFADHKILFHNERTVGIGDLDLEFLAAYDYSQECFFDIFCGIRFPTAQRQKDSGKVLFQPLGNHGHFEFKIGNELGWHPTRVFALKADWWFSHVFKRTEKKAAPFKGATIRNIGPEIEADVSWNYFVVHCDATIFHPRCHDAGMSLGYELFAKRKDNVSFCQKKAVDFAGILCDLDSCILERGTDSMTHKVRGELFYKWNCFELFVGGSHIFAGKNAMKETEGFLGVAITF